MGCEEDGRGDFDGKIWTVCHGGILLDEDLAKYGTNFSIKSYRISCGTLKFLCSRQILTGGGIIINEFP